MPFNDKYTADDIAKGAFERAKQLPVSQRSKLINNVDQEYGSTEWRNNREYVTKFSNKVNAALKRNKGKAMPLEEKASNRDLGAQSKIAKAEMGNSSTATMAEELSKGDAALAQELETGFQRTAERMRQERLAGRRVSDSGPPSGITERRLSPRRNTIEDIKRLKTVRSNALNPGPRDTHKYDIPKIDERIAQARKSLIETAPGPSRSGALAEEIEAGAGRLSGIAGKTGRVLGVAGTAASIPAHWRALNAVNTEENKNAPWIDKFGAYVEQVMGMPKSSLRQPLPSEVRAENST